MALPFVDRREAGRLLAAELSDYAARSDVIVLGLPRGGVVVAREVAGAIGAPLDVFVVRKLGAPGLEEMAMGAVATGGVRVLNQDVISELGITPDVVEAETARQEEELARRDLAYRADRQPPVLNDRTVILVDDGLATGATMRAAVEAVRHQHPARVIVAVPVAAAETCADLRGEADELICLAMPRPFHGVGRWYEDFEQVTDEQVREALASGDGPEDSEQSGAEQRSGARAARGGGADERQPGA